MKANRKDIWLYGWAPILACECMFVGWNWDISWHRSVGRDTVWTPAHLAIYAALLIAFAYNALLVASATWGRDRAAGGTIKVLGLSGPAGAFVTLWGILLQVAAIFFDNWWHGVYGLDVVVFSPPHAILGWGIVMFYLGQFLLAVRFRNATLATLEATTRWQIIVLWSLYLGHAAINVDPLYGPLAVRSPAFVLSSTLGFPGALALLPTYLGRRWAGLAAAALHMAAIVLFMQVFQLFPATPRFAPVYHRLTHFLPPPFPLWLVVPAVAVALALPRELKPTLRAAALLGAVFVVSFNATNWLSSSFMTSPWAQNRFFAGGYPGSAFEADFRHIVRLGLNGTGAAVFAVSVVTASLMSAWGLFWGRWLRALTR